MIIAKTVESISSSKLSCQFRAFQELNRVDPTTPERPEGAESSQWTAGVKRRVEDHTLMQVSEAFPSAKATYRSSVESD